LGTAGVDVEDVLADSWISRFVCIAESPDEMKARIRDAGFHKGRTLYRCKGCKSADCAVFSRFHEPSPVTAAQGPCRYPTVEVPPH
jgi:hypothetical protein